MRRTCAKDQRCLMGLPWLHLGRVQEVNELDGCLCPVFGVCAYILSLCSTFAGSVLLFSERLIRIRGLKRHISAICRVIVGEDETRVLLDQRTL